MHLFSILASNITILLTRIERKNKDNNISMKYKNTKTKKKNIIYLNKPIKIVKLSNEKNYYLIVFFFFHV